MFDVNEPIFTADSPGYPEDLTSRPYQNVGRKGRTECRTQRSDGTSDAKVGPKVGTSAMLGPPPFHDILLSSPCVSSPHGRPQVCSYTLCIML